MALLFQLETIVVEMQDSKSGVKGSEQKLNVTTIPHVITGETGHVYTHLQGSSKSNCMLKSHSHIIFQVNIKR